MNLFFVLTDRERTASQNGEDAPDVDFFEAEASSFSVKTQHQPLAQNVKLAVRFAVFFLNPHTFDDIFRVQNLIKI